MKDGTVRYQKAMILKDEAPLSEKIVLIWVTCVRPPPSIRPVLLQSTRDVVAFQLLIIVHRLRVFW